MDIVKTNYAPGNPLSDGRTDQAQQLHQLRPIDASVQVSQPDKMPIDPLSAAMGPLLMPSLHDMHAVMSHLLQSLKAGDLPLEAEIAEPLHIVLQSEINQIDFAISDGIDT